MAFNPNPRPTTDDTLRDWQHAANMFNVDQFRLAPKQNFLFHVAFGINKAAVSNSALLRHGSEINMLVKNIELPQFQIKTETLNQYNRKKNVQYIQDYQEIGVKFHDDNMGLINQLWQNYYSYYYADSNSAEVDGAYNRIAMKNSNYIPSNYGFDNGSTSPFFKYIKIFQMARHEYVMYQLWNPIITSWNFNKLDYSDGSKTHDNDMKLKYEAVSYKAGNVSDGEMEGFGNEHYDVTPSPLQSEASTTIVSPTFISDNSLKRNGASIINNIVTQINTAQNTKQPGANVNTSLLTTKPTQTINGIPGVTFPRNRGGTPGPTATPITP